jgi:hypothetical protein
MVLIIISSSPAGALEAGRAQYRSGGSPYSSFARRNSETWCCHAPKSPRLLVGSCQTARCSATAARRWRPAAWIWSILVVVGEDPLLVAAELPDEVADVAKLPDERLDQFRWINQSLVPFSARPPAASASPARRAAPCP